ncbi:aminotransferase class I/II-fold pyridoxal phosphate-dependent enzyme [Halobacillus mangrovi]|uniref:aminotransferase class I/II-fold pyridoxal phosphate-dependent enzyme n=1 Tax=Halobacillus mangrovi TaxID=402384 RepID=UPI0012F4FF84|nr:aminotransferase class V-fold PLP-dependent enzyme [Halobacillus mangrovi]
MSSQCKTPLYDALVENKKKNPLSFHVPGHKYGQVFSQRGKEDYSAILTIDATEINGLDDLHAPEGVINQAQKLAAAFFQCEHTYFLVNGTTSGNLAMLLSICGPGDDIIVQRNCHKSVLNGLELAGAKPIFIGPEYEEETKRYSKITLSAVRKALKTYPKARAIFLTYPDYFGRTYPLQQIIKEAHAQGIPVCIDEAHGVHFQLGDPFPPSALQLGADMVVQSAHKMAPAMTMASYLHVQGRRVNRMKIEHYLQMLQSSSPSYPLMASLDLARYYLAHWKEEKKRETLQFIEQIRSVFESYEGHWSVLPVTSYDDPLKMTLRIKKGTGFQVMKEFEKVDIHPEMAAFDQILFTFGLAPSLPVDRLKECLDKVDSQLKYEKNRATINIDQISFPEIETLVMQYSEMSGSTGKKTDWDGAVGKVSAEAVIPYPPGIPLLLKGERITDEHKKRVLSLVQKGARFQNKNIEQGIRVFKGE